MKDMLTRNKMSTANPCIVDPFFWPVLPPNGVHPSLSSLDSSFIFPGWNSVEAERFFSLHTSVAASDGTTGIRHVETEDLAIN